MLSVSSLEAQAILSEKTAVSHMASLTSDTPQDSQDVVPSTDKTPSINTPDTELTVVQLQQNAASDFQDLELVLMRMTEIMSVTDPDRAELLKRVITQSKERLINGQFDAIIKMLGDGATDRALDSQKELETDLRALLTLLESENRSLRIKDEKARYEQYRKEVTQLIREQKSLYGRTQGSADIRRLSDEQDEIAKKTRDLSEKIRSDEKAVKENEKGSDSADGEQKSGEQKGGEQKSGEQKGGEQKGGEQKGGEQKGGEQKGGEQKGGEQKGGEQKGGEQKGGEQKGGEQKGGEQKGGEQKGGEQKDGEQKPDDRLEEAQKKMEDAKKKLEDSQKKGALADQEEAIRELEKAKAELEEILRQLRQEETKRYLAQLEARITKMLQMQQTVYDGTMTLEKVEKARRTHDHTIEATRLSGREAEIVLEADKTLLLLREDGTSMAFPEVLGQARDDMRRVSELLGKADTGELTISLEEDILAALEEMLAAVKKAQKEQEEKEQKQQPQQPQQQQQQNDAALIDKIADLKLLRSMQLRVNKRTERLGKMVRSEKTDNPDVHSALKDLSKTQERIQEITRDMGMGKNK